jgi:plasmid stability protein
VIKSPEVGLSVTFYVGITQIAEEWSNDFILYIVLSLTYFLGDEVMAVLTVRNLPDAVHRALRMRAADHGRSTEAEIRDILEKAAFPAERVKLGSLLASIAREAGGLTNAEAERFNLRDKTPAEPMSFE